MTQIDVDSLSSLQNGSKALTSGQCKWIRHAIVRQANIPWRNPGHGPALPLTALVTA